MLAKAKDQKASADAAMDAARAERDDEVAELVERVAELEKELKVSAEGRASQTGKAKKA